MKEDLTQENLGIEITRRENSSSREVNITDVSRVLRHALEVLSEYSDEEIEAFVFERIAFYRDKKNNRPKISDI